MATITLNSGLEFTASIDDLKRFLSGCTIDRAWFSMAESAQFFGHDNHGGFTIIVPYHSEYRDIIMAAIA